MNIELIPSTQLVPSPANVRKTGAKTGIEDLGRQHRRARLVAKPSGAPRQGRQLSKLSPEAAASPRSICWRSRRRSPPIFRCRAMCSTATDATEISLAENEMREAMHPADQFEAFKKLADEGKGPEEIAARFGITPQIVGSGSSWPWSARS